MLEKTVKKGKKMQRAVKLDAKVFKMVSPG